MATINNPGRFDCLAKLKPDEPYFLLRGQDRLAPKLVRDWAEEAHANGVSQDKVAEALQCADDMDAWQRANGGGKVPD